MKFDYFPPDVRVRITVSGNERELLGQARRVLFKALHMQAAGSAEPIVVTERPSPDVQITARIFQGQKILTISAVPTAPEVEYPPLPEDVVPEPELGTVINMYSGWIKNGNNVMEEGVGKIDSFRPTQSCAKAYKLPRALHTSKKLYIAGNDQIKFLKASAFSGRMKAVVQALLGLGTITDPTPSYITEQAPNPEKRGITIPYQYGFLQTHGLYKAGPKNHWIIEISNRGVLAMPLILFPSTKTAGYRKYLLARGDVGSLRVVDEFGGIPTGEGFPDSAALESAIAAGKVLRLIDTAGMAEFYGHATPWFTSHGWAFSDSGARANQTCLAWILPSGAFTSGFTIAGNPSLFGEHWSVSITLSAHNIAALAQNNPVGSGSAALSLVHRGRVPRTGLKSLIRGPSSTGLPEFNDAYDSAPTGTHQPEAYSTPYGADVSVFYDGEFLHRVKYVAQVTKKSTTEVTAGAPGWPPYQPSFANLQSMADSAFDASKPEWWDYYDIKRAFAGSPAGFISTLFDWRMEYASRDWFLQVSYDDFVPQGVAGETSFGSCGEQSAGGVVYFPRACREGVFFAVQHTTSAGPGVRAEGPYNSSCTPLSTWQHLSYHELSRTTQSFGFAILAGLGMFRATPRGFGVVTYVYGSGNTPGYGSGSSIPLTAGKYDPARSSTATVSCGPTASYCIDNVFVLANDLPADCTRVGLPEGFEGIASKDINFIGSI